MKRVWQNRAIYVDDTAPEDIIALEDARGVRYDVLPTLEHFPPGAQGLARHLGIAADASALDFSVVHLARPNTAAAVYTRNLCVSPAITFDRENTNRGLIQLVCVISKNASVFTPSAKQDIENIAQALAAEFRVAKQHVLISCTGVIGRSLPVERIVNGIPGLSRELRPEGVEAVSRAIMTTDKRPKLACVRIGDVVIAGYAKGAGMIEPNMATMLVYLYTNAKLPKPELDRALKQAVDPTFNSMSVDTDTSTSDTVALLSSGEVAVGDATTFQLGLTAICLKLARAVAQEAEGATKLLEVTVQLGTSHEDALFFAKKVVNSPLVKTAVHGGDPNWGRVVMAIGKPVPGSPLLSIQPDEVVIAIQGQTMYDRGKRLDVDLPALSSSIKSNRVVTIDVTIGNPVHTATVWGCDLSAEYVHENAHYTT